MNVFLILVLASLTNLSIGFHLRYNGFQYFNIIDRSHDISTADSLRIKIKLNAETNESGKYTDRENPFFIREAIASDMGFASKILTDGFFGETNFIRYQFEKFKTYLNLESCFPLNINKNMHKFLSWKIMCKKVKKSFNILTPISCLKFLVKKLHSTSA